LGVALAWIFYIKRPDIPDKIRNMFGPIYTLLDNKYYFDKFNDWFFANGARKLGSGLWRFGDVTIIDGLMVNGSAKLVGWFSTVARRAQTGFIYHYAFVMIIGVAAFLWLKRA
jgi:NADH-quinone oxidoreductase subunit L